MADCKIVNQQVLDAVTAINTLQTQYQNAGDTFVSEFKAAIAEMEGETKDELFNLFTKNYEPFVSSEENGIPGMIKGMSSLLEGNRKNFEDSDSQIAASIRQ